jgi:two-component system cell cycle sensor histidine kinase/response regulator CckA
MSTPTVLLLDDDANTLVALGAILARTNVRVLESEDEEGALGLCKQLSERIDLMVADVILPGSNGPEVVRRVKALQPLMRLLFISGFNLSELGKRGLLRTEDLAPGSVEFLQKPFTPEAFLASVQNLLPS